MTEKKYLTFKTNLEESLTILHAVGTKDEKKWWLLRDELENLLREAKLIGKQEGFEDGRKVEE